MNPQTLEWLLGKLGVKIDPIGINLLVEFLHANVGQKKIATLLENQALMSDLDALLTNFMGSNESVHDAVESMNVRSVIRCPHCNLAFPIIDAPGVRDILNEKRE